MIEALFSFLVLAIVVCVIAGLILWAVQRFFPEIYTPTRLIVGAIAVVVILLALLRLVQRVLPALP